MMDNATRLQYLAAMDIDVWVPWRQPIAIPRAANDNGKLNEDAGRTDGYMNAGDRPSNAQGATPDPQTAPEFAVFGTPNTSAIAEKIETHHAPHDEASRFDEPWFSLPTRPTHSSHAGDHAWTELQHEVAHCRACSLCETRTQTVFGVGNKHASWLLIGEAPGQNEDLQGEPFVGRAGQLLTEMLRAIGLTREDVYIANMLKCRPPNNRDPQVEEVAACHHFLQRQIALLQPKIILAVGRIAAQNLLKTHQPLAKLRGVRHQLDNIPLIVIHHPAYLLRSLPEKAKAWEDLQFALSIYKELE